MGKGSVTVKGVGDRVACGEPIGRVGNSGYVISLGGGGYHLHFEAQHEPWNGFRGTPFDPYGTAWSDGVWGQGEAFSFWVGQTQNPTRTCGWRGVNILPVAENGTVTAAAGTTGSIPIVLSARDDHGPLPPWYYIQLPPRHGTLQRRVSLEIDGSEELRTVDARGSGAEIIYMPAGTVTADSFTFVAHDGFGESNAATISIIVQPRPDTTPPNAPTSLTATAVSTSQINLTWRPSNDSGGSGLAGYGVYRGGAQVATTAGTIHSDMGLSDGTPYCYTVVAYDNAGNASSQSEQRCTTTATANQAPVASDQSVSVSYNTATAITLIASDPDNGPQALTYSIVSPPTRGTLTVSGASRTYTPNTGYSGPDSFTFKANDGAADSNTATVSITVQQPGNACAGATVLALGVPIQGSTVGQATEGPTLGCEPNCGTTCNSAPDAWHTVTPTADGSTTVSLCSDTTYDSIVAVYSGTCGALNQLACDDDGCGGAGGSSQASFTSTANTTYLIRVTGWKGASGNYTIIVTQVSCPPPPEWVECDCPDTHYCFGIECNGVRYHEGDIYCFYDGCP
jgi:chitodextrinase